MSRSETTTTTGSQPILVLHGLFVLSGMAGLIFETLWFRLAGLSFGNTVWAATAVLAAFMAGLALGNGMAARVGETIQRPLHFYAAAEVLVAASGLLLVPVLPNIGLLLAPVTQTLLQDSVWALNGLRLLSAFLLMMIPATAMGLTLPLLVRSLQGSAFNGLIIGRLYGWNTLGAVSGVLLAEWLLFRWLGLVGSAVFAAALCLIAAGGAWLLARHWPRIGTRSPVHRVKHANRSAWQLAAAATLAGGILLGLEVAWFRLLLLHIRGTATAFAGMLAIVLAGIGLGGLLASLWFRHRTAGPGAGFILSATAALLIPVCYAALHLPAPIWLRAVILMLPAAVVSGALLPALAATLSDRDGRATRATGRLWLANTAGGAVGAALCGLLFLPLFGIEPTLLALGLSYVAVAFLLLPVDLSVRRRMPAIGVLLSVVLVYGLFPRGWIQDHLEQATQVYRRLDGSQTIATREGLNETVQLLERRLFDQPFSYRLVTDGYSMSGTERDSRRYMKMFAWLPQSLHAQPGQVLLISYGVGTTARALLDDPALKSLDVVDLSPDVLAMSPLIHGSEGDPLQDDRVRLHVEDGRQFLLLTDRRYDIITAEPPPPRMKGVVNLYTREYFRLIHERLLPGGYSSYWLPADQLTLDSARAVIAAFCAVFTDCSLWAGSNYNWILLGGKGLGGGKADTGITIEQLVRLWSYPENTRALRALGLEEPALLGVTFLADAEQLRDWTGDSPALSDYWPKRLDEQQAGDEDIRTYAAWADNLAARERFVESLWVRERFPADYRLKVVPLFELQPIFNNELRPDPLRHIPIVHDLLQTTEYRTPVYWLLDSGLEEQRLLDALLDESYQPAFAYPLGVRALAQENFTAAASLFGEALQAGDRRALGPAVYSLCREQRLDEARTLAARYPVELPFKCWN